MSQQEEAEIRQGTRTLTILKTMEAMSPLHGYGIARRIEQTSGDAFEVPYGTIYPSLVKLERKASSHPGGMFPPTTAKAKYYELTRAGKKHVYDEERQWEQTVNIISRFLNPKKETA